MAKYIREAMKTKKGSQKLMRDAELGELMDEPLSLDDMQNILRNYFKYELRGGKAEGGITSMNVDDLPMSKEGFPKYYNPEGEEISFKEFQEAMKKEKQIMPKKKPSKIKKAEGGLMDLDGNEMDLRGGGFVPIGAKEKADDVPARLSKNEFVFTADAVRAAGGGSIEKGAQKMYNTMKQLEKMV